MSKPHKLEQIHWGVMPYTVYRGVLIEKTPTGYKVLNQSVSSPKEVDKVIQEGLKHLSRSIKNYMI